jgi:hypothetical protein
LLTVTTYTYRKPVNRKTVAGGELIGVARPAPEPVENFLGDVPKSTSAAFKLAL